MNKQLVDVENASSEKYDMVQMYLEMYAHALTEGYATIGLRKGNEYMPQQCQRQGHYWNSNGLLCQQYCMPQCQET